MPGISYSDCCTQGIGRLSLARATGLGFLVEVLDIASGLPHLTRLSLSHWTLTRDEQQQLRGTASSTGGTGGSTDAAGGSTAVKAGSTGATAAGTTAAGVSSCFPTVSDTNGPHVTHDPCESVILALSHLERLSSLEIVEGLEPVLLALARCGAGLPGSEAASGPGHGSQLGSVTDSGEATSSRAAVAGVQVSGDSDDGAGAAGSSGDRSSTGASTGWGVTQAAADTSGSARLAPRVRTTAILPRLRELQLGLMGPSLQVSHLRAVLAVLCHVSDTTTGCPGSAGPEIGGGAAKYMQPQHPAAGGSSGQNAGGLGGSEGMEGTCAALAAAVAVSGTGGSSGGAAPAAAAPAPSLHDPEVLSAAGRSTRLSRLRLRGCCHVHPVQVAGVMAAFPAVDITSDWWPPGPAT